MFLIKILIGLIICYFVIYEIIEYLDILRLRYFSKKKLRKVFFFILFVVIIRVFILGYSFFKDL